jgi:hypothetical protein
MQYAIMRLLRATVVLFILFSTLAPLRSFAEGLGGSWEGEVTQSGDSPSTYRMEMQLYGKAGSIHYPTLGCGGNLEFIKTDGTSFWYRERITSGKDKCIDGGVIQLRRHALGGDTTWDWRWEGGGITVRGVIRGSGAEQK